MHFLEEIKKWIGEITEIALLLIALAVAIEILFGPQVSFFGGPEGIVVNITTLLGALGDKGLVGLLAMGIIIWLFYRKRTAPQG